MPTLNLASEALLPRSVPPGRRLELPGRGTTWVREAGQRAPGRPTLVLLHGWTATGAINWVASFAPLSARFHVVALDQRGHGRGVRTGALRGFRLEDCADDVAAVANQLDLGSIIPVGYSMGGPVAQLTWRRHRDRVAGLVLCATAARFGPKTAAGTGSAIASMAMSGGVAGAATALRTLPPFVRRRVATAGRGLGRRVNGGLPEWALAEVSRSDPAALLEGLSALRGFDSTKWLEGVDVPTAIIVTGHDSVVPPASQRSLAAAIGPSRTWTVSGDHTACVTAPRSFTPALVGACDWVIRRGRPTGSVPV